MKKYFPTTYTILSLSILFCLSISIASCKDDQPITPQEEPLPEENKPEENEENKPESGNEQQQNEPIIYEQFEGYMLTLDPSEKPTLGGYEAEKNIPAAKLMGISHEYTFSNDMMKDNNQNINLGYECKLQQVGNYLVVFAHYKGIKDDNQPSKITIIKAKDMNKEREVEYMLDEYEYLDFIFATSDKRVIYGLYDSEIHSFDLETQEKKQATTMNYNWRTVAVDQNGCLLIGKDNVLSKYDSEKFTEKANISLPETFDKIYKLNDDYVLAKAKNYYLISTSDMKLIAKFDLPKNVSERDLIYDKKGNRIFVPGKDKTKNIIYNMCFNNKEPQLTKFYIIPPKDINMDKTNIGNAKLGINPDTYDLYIANIQDQYILETPEVNRNTGSGRITRISLKEEKKLPVAQADKVEKIDDMYSFSPFVYISPSSKPAQ